MIASIRQSISRKLMLLVLATTFLALLVYAVTLLVVDIRNYQGRFLNDLQTQADILATVSAPALEFNDRKVAAENLQQLRSRPMILHAALYTPGGKLFATYASRNAPPTPPPARAGSGYIIKGNDVMLFQTVRRDNEVIGTVYLHAAYGLEKRVIGHLEVLAAVMACSLLVAAIVSAWLQAAITRPLLAMTDIARRVMRDRDFSLRVNRTTEDETGVLVDAFNDMLGEIGHHAQALRQSNEALIMEMHERRSAEKALQILNETLEQRIAARTAELEQAHEQLRQSQKMEAVGQLTGGIAHDFNNLLAGIVGNLELIQFRLEQGRIDDLPRYTEAALSAADRASGLIQRLLAFSRRQTLAPEVISINRLVDSMLALIRHSVGPAIQVEARLAEGLWLTRCDPNQLENALLNLAINARDAMPDSGKLLIETGNAVLHDQTGKTGPNETMHDYALVSVSDTGCGMTPEVLARAVDPFFTTKPLGQGTGLGLSMVYGFVNQSGGQMRIQSRTGVGTAIRLYLPRHDGQETVHSASREPGALHQTPQKRAIRILLVDDEAGLRHIATELLEEQGYSVLACGDANEALPLLRSLEKIDLLITDIGLPSGMNGRQLADAARELRPGLRVLFVTGYAQAALSSKESLKPGMDLLAKPFKLEVFATTVSRMLESVLTSSSTDTTP